MIIYWTQKLKNGGELNISVSFLQCEIFVESWQMICLILDNDPKTDFIYPSEENLPKIVEIVSFGQIQTENQENSQISSQFFT